MNTEETAKGYVFYRRNVADLDVKGTMPSTLSYKELRALLPASVRSVDATIRKLIAGQKVRTRYGLYWAEPKQ